MTNRMRRVLQCSLAKNGSLHFKLAANCRDIICTKVFLNAATKSVFSGITYIINSRKLILNCWFTVQTVILCHYEISCSVVSTVYYVRDRKSFTFITSV